MPLSFRLKSWSAAGLFGLSALMLAQAPLSASAQQLDAEALGPVIREYLLANPEVVIEAINLYQSQEQQREAQAAAAAITSQRDVIYASASSPVIGDPGAEKVIVEFFDYQCGYCKRAAEGLYSTIESRDDLKIVMKEFPILGPDSVVAARASLAAAKQDKYAEMHWAMIRFKGRLNDRAIMAIAKENGLDVDQLQKDMQSPEVQAEIDATARLARSLNIGGTPAFIVADQLIPGAVPTEQLIALAEGN